MTRETLHEVERRLAHDRNEIGETLSIIQQRLSPERMANQALDYLKDNGGDMAMHLGRAMKENPLPLIMTGVGLAWLIGSSISSRPNGDHRGRSRRPTARAFSNSTYDENEGYGEYEAQSRDTRDPIKGYGSSDYTPYDQRDDKHSLLERARAAADSLQQSGEETAEAFSERVAHAKAQILDIQRQAGETVSDFTQRIEEKMTSVSESVKQHLHDASDRATDLARRARHEAEDMRDRATDAFQHQPLAAVAIGIGVGALIGALVPMTRREQELLAPYGEEARERVRGVAKDIGDKAEHIAADAAESAVQTVDEGVRQTVQTH